MTSAPTLLSNSEPLLEVRQLSVEFRSARGAVQAVNDVSFALNQGETLALVGESGSGKSVTAMSILRLIESQGGTISGGQIRFEGRNILQFSESEVRQLRGNNIGMVFQEPMTSLNPVYTVGDQIGEVLELHRGLSDEANEAEIIRLLELVQIPDAARRKDEYPHQLSGGMRQRVMIAMALACNPRLLIADEPTTALDVTIQAQILELLKSLQQQLGMALLLITHDLGVVASTAHRVAVMQAGKVVETASVLDLFQRPQHPYTQHLLSSIPALKPPSISPKGTDKPSAVSSPDVAPADTNVLLRVETLSTHFELEGKWFSRKRDVIRAVNDVSFELHQGETVGLVGESGCGKSTLGRTILRLIRATHGKVTFLGQDLETASKQQLRALRREMQIIFQDPFSSLNPKLRVADILGEPLFVHGIAKGADLTRQVAELLEAVGLPRRAAERYPHEFSGGQRQRIGIARALALKPKLVVCDEAVSALDVSIRGQVLSLLLELKQRFQLTYLFISHDLSVIQHICDRVMVMYLGQIVEQAPTQLLFAEPRHPYTEALISAVPVPDPNYDVPRIVLHGDIPSPRNPPPGCSFHPRCPKVLSQCATQAPRLLQLDGQRAARCWLNDSTIDGERRV